MQMTQRTNWPIFDLKFVKKLTLDSISCTFENQKRRLTTASEQCFCLIRCKKGSGWRLSVGEHLSNNLLSTVQPTRKGVWRRQILNLDHNVEKWQQCAGFVRLHRAMIYKCFNMRPFVDWVVYLWQSNHLTGGIYCYKQTVWCGGCCGTAMSVQNLLWFWLRQLLYSLLIPTKHVSVGFLGLPRIMFPDAVARFTTI